MGRSPVRSPRARSASCSWPSSGAGRTTPPSRCRGGSFMGSSSPDLSPSRSPATCRFPIRAVHTCSRRALSCPRRGAGKHSRSGSPPVGRARTARSVPYRGRCLRRRAVMASWSSSSSSIIGGRRALGGAQRRGSRPRASSQCPRAACGGSTRTSRSRHWLPPADMFAFGVIAFQLCTGERPFAQPPVLACLGGATPLPAASLASRCRHAPAALAALVDACLALDPERRPTASEVATSLRAVER